MVSGNFPNKDDSYRTRLTVGSDSLPYFDDSTSRVASLIETKLILNSDISDVK